MIGKLRAVVRQLRGRSSHELYSRAAQRAYSLAERTSLQLTGSAHQRASLPDVSHAFQQSFFPALSGGAKRIAETVDALRQHVPHDEAETLARATAAERGDITLFGLGTINIGSSPDWQLDPFAKLRAPQQHWSTFNYLDRTVVGDHKIVWEINRHQYFLTFGQAYAYAGDERWPRAFVRMFDSWIAGNPPTIGMNWCSSLEVSYRAISWIWAMHFMRESATIDSDVKARVLASLDAHGRHLERYLSTYFSPNTHLTGEALGLFYIGTQCPELPDAARWANLGASVLESALDRQVLSDGVYFEQATQYHRYTIDIYLQYWLLAKQTGRVPAAKVESALRRMFDFLLSITRPDGTYPLMGDDDGGRLLQLDGRKPDDARALLGTGAALLKRADLAWMGRGDDAALLWMLGASSVGERDTLVGHAPQELARAYDAGGVYTMRDGWNTDSSLAVVDAGPHGALSFGHSHADALSIDLTVAGRPVFVDAGTYTYVGDERNTFRSTAAHNTVEIDGVSTSIPSTAFRWSKVAHARATGWLDAPDFTWFCGTHDGYRDLGDPVQHERSVLHNKDGIWIVRDSVQAKGRHTARLRWHLAAGLTASARDSGSNSVHLRVREGDASRALLILAGSEGGKGAVERGWSSSQFGQKAQVDVCEWLETTNGNAVLASIVIDTARYRVATPETVARLARVQGAVVVVALEATHDPMETVLVVAGNGSGIKYDSEWLEPAGNGSPQSPKDVAVLHVDALSGKLLRVVGASTPLLSQA